MNCREFDEIADSYLSNELLVETNHDFISHLRNCGDCRTALAELREFRLRVRSAGRSASAMDPALRVRIRERVYANAAARPGRILVPSLAFAALIGAVVAGFAVFSLRYSPIDKTAGDTYLTQGADLFEALHSAVGNHKDCGLKFGSQPAKEIKPDYAKLKADYEELEYVEEHDCIFSGKKYSHVIFRNGPKLISVLKSPADHRRGSATIVSIPLDSFQLAEFESGDQTVFVISDLSESENLHFARRVFERSKSL